jgi:hypothetical protein
LGSLFLAVVELMDMEVGAMDILYAIYKIWSNSLFSFFQPFFSTLFLKRKQTLK